MNAAQLVITQTFGSPETGANLQTQKGLAYLVMQILAGETSITAAANPRQDVLDYIETNYGKSGGLTELKRHIR